MVTEHPTIDPTAQIVGAKLSWFLDSLKPLDLTSPDMIACVERAIGSGLLGKDGRPKLSDEEQQVRADRADERDRHHATARNWLEINLPPVFVPADRSSFKSIPELLEAMNIPRVERIRYQHALRSVLMSGQTDWGMVCKIDGLTFYGARPRLLQYDTPAAAPSAVATA